jgi:hypothetical protein
MRKQELVQAAVRQLGVGLDPCPADHVHAVLGFGDRHSVVEKDRFPDARCAPQPQRAAAIVARICQQALNSGLLDVPSHQRHAVTLVRQWHIVILASEGVTTAAALLIIEL